MQTSLSIYWGLYCSNLIVQIILFTIFAASLGSTSKSSVIIANYGTLWLEKKTGHEVYVFPNESYIFTLLLEHS